MPNALDTIASTAPMGEPASHAAGADALRQAGERRSTTKYRYVRWRWRAAATLIDAVGWTCVGLVRWLRRWFVGRDVSAFNDPQRILLVQLDHLGDAIITTAMLPALRRRYPRARIEVLAAPWNREVFALCPEVDEIIVSARNRFARGPRWGWLAATLLWGWRLRRRRYDLAIDVRGELPLACLLRMTGAKRRVGWACGGGGFWLSDNVDWVPERAEVESRGAILAALGIEDSLAASLRPIIAPPDDARRELAARTKSWGRAHRRRVVMHVGAGTPAKRWPVEHWRRLVARLVSEHESQIVLVGGSDESATARAIHAGIEWPAVVDWTGRLTVAQLAALLELSDVFIGADSGPAHLAAAVGTPTVVLFSGTNRAAQWTPRGERVTVLRHDVACAPCHRESCALPDHPCMRGVLPARVVQAVAALLSLDDLELSHDRAAS